MSGARARGAAPLSPGPRSEPRAAPGPHSSQRGLASVGQAPSSLHSSAAPGWSSLLFILCYGQAKAFLSIQVGRVPRLEGPRRFPEQQSCPVAAQLQTPKRAGRAAGTAGEGARAGGTPRGKRQVSPAPSPRAGSDSSPPVTSCEGEQRRADPTAGAPVPAAVLLLLLVRPEGYAGCCPSVEAKFSGQERSAA